MSQERPLIILFIICFMQLFKNSQQLLFYDLVIGYLIANIAQGENDAGVVFGQYRIQMSIFMKPVGLPYPPFKQISVYRLFELPFGNGNDYLNRVLIRNGFWHVNNPEGVN